MLTICMGIEFYFYKMKKRPKKRIFEINWSKKNHRTPWERKNKIKNRRTSKNNTA